MCIAAGWSRRFGRSRRAGRCSSPMSQLAQFFLIGADRVPRPLETESFDWSGYYFVVLLTCLDEQGVDLMDEERDAAASALGETTFVFTPAHRAHLGRLDPGDDAEDDLRRYFEEFNEYD